MGFINNYLEKHKLPSLDDKYQNNVDKLEEKLDNQVNQYTGGITFEDLLKEYGPQISDLTRRASNALSGGFVFSKFRVIINIGIEAYQIVGQMVEKVVGPDMSKEELHQVKSALGSDLIYFIWTTINPLQNYCNWLPFKTRIEKWIVKLLAGYALNAAFDLIEANTGQVATMSAGIKLRGLP